MKKIRISKFEALFLFLLISIIITVVYVHTNHPKPLKQFLYNLEYPFALSTIRCSPNSPKFMHELMLTSIKEQKAMSNQLAYQNPEGVMYHCESGWQDGFLGSKNLTPDTRFRFASITKVLTAEIIFQLIEEKKISLETRLVDILEMNSDKFVDQRMNNITIKMLLEHSAGFDRYITFTPMLTFDTKPWCPTDTEQLYNIKLDYEPNTEFQYSNLGYCLLEASIAKISNKKFREVANKRLNLDEYEIKFINDKYFSDELEYDFRFEGFLGDWYLTKLDFQDSLSGTAGLSGSAQSLVKLIAQLNTEKLVNIKSRSDLPCAIGTIDACYGYAMLAYKSNGSNLIFFNKSGSLPGVETDVIVDGNGGVLAIFRGATAPNYEITVDLRKKIYQDLISYYRLKSNGESFLK